MKADLIYDLRIWYEFGFDVGMNWYKIWYKKRYDVLFIFGVKFV